MRFCTCSSEMTLCAPIEAAVLNNSKPVNQFEIHSAKLPNNTYMSIIPKRTSVRQSRIIVFFKQTIFLAHGSRVFDKIQTLRSDYQLIHNVIYKFILQQNYFFTYSYTHYPNVIRKHNYQRVCFPFNYHVQFYSNTPLGPI